MLAATPASARLQVIARIVAAGIRLRGKDRWNEGERRGEREHPAGEVHLDELRVVASVAYLSDNWESIRCITPISAVCTVTTSLAKTLTFTS